MYVYWGLKFNLFMKNIIIIILIVTTANLLNAEQAPDNKTKYQIIDDSVHYTDGRVISFEQFSKENQQLDSIHLIDGSVYSKEEYKIMLSHLVRHVKNVEKPTKKENKELENGRIISNWKFYTIMLAFPIFLILLFVLVFVRGRRKQ